MTDAVWPDGAREAVEAAYRFLWTRKPNVRPPLGDTILTALEPFVQQRINTAVGMQTNIAKSNEHSLRAEVARLREDGERYEAVLRLLAVDVLYCHRGDDGAVTAFINLNDYFVPSADGEAIAMDDAPTLAALYDQGGWPAISQWVADRRGIPNQHWRKRQIDAARSARGGEG